MKAGRRQWLAILYFVLPHCSSKFRLCPLFLNFCKFFGSIKALKNPPPNTHTHQPDAHISLTSTPCQGNTVTQTLISSGKKYFFGPLKGTQTIVTKAGVQRHAAIAHTLQLGVILFPHIGIKSTKNFYILFRK